MAHVRKAVLHQSQHRIIRRAAGNERNERRKQEQRRGRFCNLRGNFTVGRGKRAHQDKQIKHALHPVL